MEVRKRVVSALTVPQGRSLEVLESIFSGAVVQKQHIRHSLGDCFKRAPTATRESPSQAWAFLKPRSYFPRLLGRAFSHCGGSV